MTTVNVNVTKEDIERSSKSQFNGGLSGYDCPITLALHKIFRLEVKSKNWNFLQLPTGPGLHPKAIYVGPTQIKFRVPECCPHGPLVKNVDLPEEARIWLDDYDNGEEVEPFSFDLTFEK